MNLTNLSITVEPPTHQTSIIMNKQLAFENLTTMWNEQQPFTKMLGMQVTKFDANEAEVRFTWQEHLVGNHIQKILHGGVTATVLDLVGGVVAAARIVEDMETLTETAIFEKLSKLGTIDMRTDYLIPGRGEEFIATAKIIRSGSKIAVTRMELHNELGKQIAFGTGTYMVG